MSSRPCGSLTETNAVIVVDSSCSSIGALKAMRSIRGQSPYSPSIDSGFRTMR